MAGIAAVFGAVALFDDQTLYPSYRATLPAFGALLIIATGLAYPGNVISRTLAAGRWWASAWSPTLGTYGIGLCFRSFVP
jgi:peptidoglycan/LPS O-acetylase OafA/YrhL